MRKQDRDIINWAKSIAFKIIDESFRDPHSLHPIRRFPNLVARQVGDAPIAGNHKYVPNTEFVRRRNGTVNFYLIAFRGDRKAIRKFDVWNDKAVLLGELSPHFGHPGRE